MRLELKNGSSLDSYINNNNEARGHHGLSLNSYNNNIEARVHIMARASFFQIIMRLESYSSSLNFSNNNEARVMKVTRATKKTNLSRA